MNVNVLYKLHALWIVASTPFRHLYIANECGHRTLRKGFMYDFQGKSIMEMPLASNNHPDYCLDCIGRMSIRCAWCGESITVGSPITLYAPKKGSNIPDYAVKYGDGEKLALVGCLSWNCADTGADMCGYWIPPGEVKRVKSPLELCLQTGKVVVVGDIRNYPATASLHSIE